jgi:hypothetical protein
LQEKSTESEVAVDSGAEAATAMRLMSAFYDVSGGDTDSEIPLGVEAYDRDKGACTRIGLDPLSKECTQAVDRLVHQGYIQPGAWVGDSYKITPEGVRKAAESDRGG